MKEAKKVRVKVKKRKIKFKNIFLLLIFLIILVNTIYLVLNIKIKNIYIINDGLISDKEIISYAKLDNYPSYLLTLKSNIKKNLLKNDYIQDVTIKKKHFKIYLYINEHKKIAIYNNKIVLDNTSLVDNTNNINYLPIVINDISTIYSDFVKGFAKVENDILLKISQIEYTPNDVDSKRFLLYMNDGNSVYITLTKIEKLNKYSSITNQMEGKQGIIYLDSGDYIELK